MASATAVAVLSDIHGNRWALEAVLADIRRRGIHERVNLGDALYGPLDPAGTAEILMALDMPAVRGNEDRILVDDARRHPDSPSLPFVHSELKAEHVAWLAALPASRSAFGFFLCHGTPRDDREYLLWEVPAGGPRQRTAAAVAERLQDVAEPVTLCGHDHLPARLDLPGGRAVVDPGSVGLPAYRDDHPFPHAMEAGSPLARYAIVSRPPSGLSVEHVAVDYDCRDAVAAAERNGRPDWAHALRTGRAAGRSRQ